MRYHLEGLTPANALTVAGAHQPHPAQCRPAAGIRNQSSSFFLDRLFVANKYNIHASDVRAERGAPVKCRRPHGEIIEGNRFARLGMISVRRQHTIVMFVVSPVMFLSKESVQRSAADNSLGLNVLSAFKNSVMSIS
jgi:hypothetical protein